MKTNNTDSENIEALRNAARAHAKKIDDTLALIEITAADLRSMHGFFASVDEALASSAMRSQRLRQLARTLEETLKGEAL